MPINKVNYGNRTLIDLSDSTLQSSDELVNGVTAYDRSGTKLTGTANYMPLIDNPTGNMVVQSNTDGEVEESPIIITDVATISSDVRYLQNQINNKQDTLVSGTNIKTINNASVLGSGNIAVQEPISAGDGIDITSNTISLDDYINLGSVSDLNVDTTDLNPYGWYKGYFSGVNVLNKPTSDHATGTFLLQLQNNATYGRQIAITDYGIYTRKLSNNVWSSWEDLTNKQDTLTAGTGITIDGNTISNVFSVLSAPNLNNITYNYQGYVISCTNRPAKASSSGELCVIARADNNYVLQIYSGYNQNNVYFRKYINGSWSDWRSDSYVAGDSVTLTHYIETAGVAGSNTTTSYFGIPLGKPVNDSVTGVTFSSLTIILCTTGGRKLNNVDVISDSSITVTSWIDKGTNQIVVRLQGLTGMTASTPQSIEISSATFTFS